MNYTKLILIAFGLLETLNVSAQSSKLIDKPAPDIYFTDVLNDAKSSYKLSDFKGKLVIIEFWATWCGHCINSLPHLAKWQKKYSKTIKIITISTDGKSRLQKFLHTKSLELPVVMDSLGEYRKYFPHFELPHTVIIDQKGFVKSITAGDKLNDKDIDLLIHGKNPILPLKE
ncbi:TlpA family protein disulfide reductase [Flectobacillus roseus]|uniref:TlpA disulfide reductase family protein n=1 Tax=Flectobacillus roseus TaxID=502259 RepID=A0ABT6Y3R8_9BACT|nr:TlpA disulfide reductase family protein [Flectobacillus roseus]MDI9858217.1 TlpA disulfide reductase family protein [Flectobacillus roseus]